MLTAYGAKEEANTSFFAGPINRYNGFADNLSRQSPSQPEWIEGIKRIITGLFKKLVLASSFAPYAVNTLDFTDPSLTPQQAILGIYAYMFYAYFDFSGITDMAIGSGKLVGIELPENFNYPFFRRNLQQFWANWHMSLTNWLTDYIYWPLARKTRHVKKLKKRPVTISVLCIIITFMVCGVWHGDGLNFFVWGTYNGVGLGILNMYTYFIKKHTSRSVVLFVNKSPVVYVVSNLITFLYVSFGFLLFACTISQLRLFFHLIVK